MELSNEQYSRIFRYIDSEMNELEKIEFNKLVNDDKELMKEVELYQDIRLTSDSIVRKIETFNRVLPPLEDEEKEMIIKARNHWEARNKKKPIPILPASTGPQATKKVNHFNRWTLMIAACFAGMLILLFTIKQNRNEDHMQQLAQKKEAASRGTGSDNVKPAVPANVNRQAAGIAETTWQSNNNNSRQRQVTQSRNFSLTANEIAAIFNNYFKPDAIPENIDERLDEAINDYKQSRFQTAVLSFTKIEQLMPRGYDENESPTFFFIPYYKAISYLATGDTENAIADLRIAITRHPDETWRLKAEWYLALAYVKKGNTESAIRLFKKISTNRLETDYKNRSLKIINQLK